MAWFSAEIGATSSVSSFEDLTDVNITSVSEGDVPVYDATNDEWVNQPKSLYPQSVALTQAEYNALEAQGLIDVDTEYFISDGQLASAPIDDNDVSPNKTWSSEKINSLTPTYSTTETVIGIYLGKPLYAMQFDCTSPSSTNTAVTVFSGMNSTMKMRNLYGVLYSGSGPEYCMPFTDGVSNTGNIWRRNATDIGMVVSAATFTSKSCSCVVEYTKTTD